MSRGLVEDSLGGAGIGCIGHQNGRGLRLRGWIGEEGKALNGNDRSERGKGRGIEREKRIV